MNKILIQLSENKIIFKSKKKLNASLEKIINTNIISNNEISFSNEYVFENEKIITSFLNQLVEENNIDSAIIYNNSLEEQILKIIKSVSRIKHLILKDDVPLSFKMCEHISKSNIKLVSCYNLQPFMLEFLDKYNVVVEIRNEYLFVSSFMEDNNLKTYSKIFYKRSINISFPFNKTDEDDFRAFLTINKYLRVIHITNFELSEYLNIIASLKKQKLTKIKIVIHSDIRDIKIIDKIKSENVKNKKTKIKTSISYSKEYIEKNLMKEAHVEILKIIMFIIIIFIALSFSFVFIIREKDERNVVKIRNEINEIIKHSDTEALISNLEGKENKVITNEYIASLLTVNKDTVGWIKINDTQVDYPVVKTTDNKFYLTNNFLKNKAYSGWIFMDARNNKLMSDDNTIIFGHNIYESPIMFGSLKMIKEEEFLENALIINYDFLYESYEYEIFSFYTIRPTDDYLRTNFTDITEKVEFFKMLKNRSDHDFKIDVDHSDKILTLSTCENGGKERFVVHAKLIK